MERCAYCRKPADFDGDYDMGNFAKGMGRLLGSIALDPRNALNYASLDEGPFGVCEHCGKVNSLCPNCGTPHKSTGFKARCRSCRTEFMTQG